MDRTEKSRTEHSARNTSVAMVSRLLAIVMGYLVRVVFTHELSETYVGIGGLFTDILNVLALSELGIGTAITYALYKPIAEKDIEKQKSLMRLFQKMYRGVALFITTIGLCLLPFLSMMIRSPEEIEHIHLIYLLYLLTTVCSYLFIYKKILLDAHQLSYIGVLYQTIFWLIQDVVQIVLLLKTQNFILFLLVHLFCTVGNNILIAKKADRLFPFLKESKVQSLPKEEKQEIVRNIKAMLMHKIGGVVVNNTDNILISSMVGIASAGVYANHYLIIASVKQLFDQAFQGCAASVGNLGVTEDDGKIRNIFDTVFFLGQWMYGFASICLFQLLTPFVRISFGERYVFATQLILILSINFYINGMRMPVIIFRDSMGLFWYDRYKAVVEAAINLVVSVILTLRLGIIGVFLGTFISTILTSFWVEPLVLYRERIKQPLRTYFSRYALYVLITLLAGIATELVCRQVMGTVVQVFLLRVLVCLFVPNFIYLLCGFRFREFHLLVEKLKGLFRKKRI